MLVSIQSLILVPDPYYNGAQPAPWKVLSSNLFVLTCSASDSCRLSDADLVMQSQATLSEKTVLDQRPTTETRAAGRSSSRCCPCSRSLQRSLQTSSGALRAPSQALSPSCGLRRVLWLRPTELLGASV